MATTAITPATATTSVQLPLGQGGCNCGSRRRDNQVVSSRMVLDPLQLAEIDLADCIEWQSVECLNENTAHTFVNALKQIIAPHSTWIRCIAHLCCQAADCKKYFHAHILALFGYREDNGLHLESDADEQLLLFIPFNQVKLHSLIIRGPPEEGPRTLKLFANRPNMGFSNVTDYPPNDTVIASLEDLEERPMPLKYVKFQSVRHLTVFVEDN
uniref:PITH domain-containing protein n=1 Tax=Physcomitrium patens TaxID=3218 RepID=A0A7I4E935_PHYPA